MARLRALIGVALAVTSGCSDNLPGEVVGAFQIVMRTEENTCGPSATEFGEGSSYRVELREDDPRGYWRLPKAAPIEGSYRDGTFEFRAQPRVSDFGRPEDGTAGCLIVREELLFGSVQFGDAGVRDEDGGAGPSPDALRAEHRISFRADPNGRCALVSGPVGVLERLPCVARYRLDGTPRAQF